MGVKTLYEYFYKLAYGDKGADKATLFNDCFDVADAEIKANKDAKHAQGTDQGLDDGGANAVVVADVKDAVTKKHTIRLDWANIVSCKDYDNPNDAIDAISSDDKTLLVTENEICDVNFTVPANVTVRFERGGKWTINNGVTVTFNGQLQAGLWQIFSYTGTGTISGSPLVNKVYPQWWATGVGSSGDTWANNCIEEAYNFMVAGTTIFLTRGYYTLANNFDITKQITVIGEGINKSIVITADAPGFQVDSPYCVFKGFTVDGDAQADNTMNRNCFFILTGSHYIRLDEIELKNAGYYGLSNNGTDYGVYTNIYSHDNYRHGLHPASDYTGLGFYNVYRNIYAFDNGVDGIDDRGSIALEKMHTLYDGIWCWGNGGRGFNIEAGDGQILNNINCFNNGTRGINVLATSNLTMNNIYAHDNEDEGIYITDAIKTTLTNVVSKNNNTDDDDYVAGIKITSCTETKMVNVKSYDDNNRPLQEYGIKVAGTTDYIELINCTLLPNEKTAISSASEIILQRDGVENATIFGTAAPAFGTWTTGDIIRKTDVAANSSPGWVCTERGTNGTLNGGGTTGDTVNGKNILIPSSLTDLVVGVYLDVTGAFAARKLKYMVGALASTTVDAASGVSEANPKLLNVTATTNFAVGETIIIDRSEIGVIASIQAGVSLTLVDDMTGDYTNETVENCIVMASNATGTVDDAAVSFHTATFQAMALLGLDGDLVDDTTPQLGGNLDMNEHIAVHEIVTIADGDTTPDISGGEIFVTSANTNPTEITDLDNAVAGQIIVIVCGSSTNASTITDGGNFRMSANWTPSVGDTMTLLVLADNDYLQLARGNN